MDKYTSLELSRKLSETEGRGLITEYQWIRIWKLDNGSIKIPNTDEWILGKMDNYTPNEWSEICPAFDILNDICCKYVIDFFGEEVFYDKYEEIMDDAYSRIKNHTENILYLIQEGKKQEAEDYIWDNCLFNKNNKN